jgi:hypothetical protein
MRTGSNSRIHPPILTKIPGLTFVMGRKKEPVYSPISSPNQIHARGKVRPMILNKIVAMRSVEDLGGNIQTPMTR